MTYASSVGDELAGLLAIGERAAFLDAPADGIAVLQRAAALAQECGDPVARGRAGWLLGVCRTSMGRYGLAAADLSVLCGDGSLPGSLRSLAASAIAAVHRQIGDAATARDWDAAALDIAADSPEAQVEAWAGLAADAVALGETGTASEAIQRAQALLDTAPQWWRQAIRLDIVRGDLALLERDPARALAAAQRAVAAAEQSAAPRQVAQGLLLAGAAAAAQGDSDGAVASLARAAVLAEELGALPLSWPSRALLAALRARRDPDASARDRRAAREVLERLLPELPEAAGPAFLARPDVAALLA